MDTILNEKNVHFLKFQYQLCGFYERKTKFIAMSFLNSIKISILPSVFKIFQTFFQNLNRFHRIFCGEERGKENNLITRGA